MNWRIWKLKLDKQTFKVMEVFVNNGIGNLFKGNNICQKKNLRMLKSCIVFLSVFLISGCQKTEFDFSTTDSKIAFISRRTHNSAGWTLMSMNMDGSGKKQLTSTWSSGIWPGWPPHGNTEPVWTPDGKKIVYVSWEDEDPEIYSMKPDASNKTKLTSTDKRDENPFVTRDGRFILFTSKRNLAMDTEIYSMTIDGRDQKPLTNHFNTDTYPVEINK